MIWVVLSAIAGIILSLLATESAAKHIGHASSVVSYTAAGNQRAEKQSYARRPAQGMACPFQAGQRSRGLLLGAPEGKPPNSPILRCSS